MLLTQIRDGLLLQTSAKKSFPRPRSTLQPSHLAPHDIDVILQDQDVRQRHHPGEQNRKDERYGVDPTDGFDEEQYNIQLLSAES